jgi:hypothetical protein
MADDRLSTKIIGPRPRRTAFQLVIASVLVGAFLAMMGVSPGEFWSWMYDLVRGIIGWLGDSIAEVIVNLGTYLLFGAAIVIPVWLLIRLIGGDGRGAR